MTHEQRAAVARLRNSKTTDRLSGYDHEALSILLDLLSDTEDERVVVVRVPRPLGVICNDKCPLLHDACGYTGCSNGCGQDWDPLGNGELPATRPYDGCPWYEGEKAHG